MQRQNIRALFTRVARHYDALNRVLTCGLDLMWRRRALATLAPAPARLLDLATGTGDLVLGAARRFPQVRVTGLDLTPAMLAIARRRVEAADCAARVTFVEGDAAHLPFEAASFDAVTCAFGFRNFPDPAAALAEVARVLVPGGTLLVLEFFRRDAASWGARFTDAWLRLGARLFAPGARADYAYLRTSMAQTLSADEFTACAEAAGFTLVQSAFFRPACQFLRLTLSP